MNRRATPDHASAAETGSGRRACCTGAGFAAHARTAVTDKKQIALFPREWLRDPASPWLTQAYHDVPWDDPEVLRACVQAGSAEARARLARSRQGALTAEKPVFGALSTVPRGPPLTVRQGAGRKS